MRPIGERAGFRMQTEPERRGHAELQLFEAALLGLALARGWTPERHGSDEWGEHIEELFGLTAGRLVRVAQIEDDVFAEQVSRQRWSSATAPCITGSSTRASCERQEHD